MIYEFSVHIETEFCMIFSFRAVADTAKTPVPRGRGRGAATGRGRGRGPGRPPGSGNKATPVSPRKIQMRVEDEVSRRDHTASIYQNRLSKPISQNEAFFYIQLHGTPDKRYVNSPVGDQKSCLGSE